MLDWWTLVEATLESLDARRYLVPGAKLLASIQKASLDQGHDFREMLRREDKKFGEFLQGFEPRITIQKRGQNDMLVGLEGAVERPIPAATSEVLKFRTDVYKAFSRSSQRPTVYSLRLDLFTHDESDPGSISVAPITQAELIDERMQFAQTIEQPLRDDIVSSLSALGPLNSFQRCVLENKLGRAWRAFHSASINRRLLAWAQANGLNVSPAWRGEQTQSYTNREVVTQVVSYMNDDEIASLGLPSRAVTIALNAMIARLTRSE